MEDPTNVIVFDKLLAESEAWVDSRGRECLGIFAVDRLLLVYAHALYLISPDTEEADYNAPTPVLIAFSKLQVSRIAATVDGGYYFGNPNTNSLKTAVFGELVMWLIADDEELKEHDIDAMEIAAFLDEVISHPSRRPYYEAGLRNGAAIDRCVVEGVEPEMARSL